MMATERLRERIARAESKVARLESRLADCGPGAEVARAFHLGTVGGSGRNVLRLNARKAAHLDRVIDDAVALPKARAEVSRLRAKLARAEAPPAPAPAKPARQRRMPRGISPDEADRMDRLGYWVLYGAADEPPPFEDITREECDRAVRFRARRAAEAQTESREEREMEGTQRHLDALAHAPGIRGRR